MKVQIEKKVGSAVLKVEVEGEKEVDALFKAAGFTTMPEICSLCKSIDIVLDGNKAKGYTFVKIKCLKCGGRSQMGQLKDGSGIFWKPFEVYKKEDEQHE